jgi:hypothetical protein
MGEVHACLSLGGLDQRGAGLALDFADRLDAPDGFVSLVNFVSPSIELRPVSESGVM